jgi:tryptophan-rich sensory protein
VKAGRILLTSVAVLTAAGGFLSDMNKTHLFNPKWTPHAKFHDAMTIMLAFMLGTSATIALTKKDGDKDFLLATGTMLPAFFWAAMASSFAFPGAAGIEAEFPGKVKKVGPVALNEGFASGTMLLLLLTGFLIEKKAVRLPR